MKDLEEFWKISGSKKFYNLVNIDQKVFKPRTKMCRDNEGNILMDKTQILKRWVEHFDEHLN
jgi:hypothetical protein